jgi:ribonuclease G
MYRTIVINDTVHETRVALLEDGTIVELFTERRGTADISGNIYKGRVQRVLPGMQAAFVDIGLNQAAFIYVDDVVLDNYHENLTCEEAAHKEEVARQAEATRKGGRDRADSVIDDDVDEAFSKAKIADLLVEGQEILVQVAKSPIGTKGARITSHISLPGRFLVLMPTSSHIGVSRKIEDETERTRLREMVADLRCDELGYIVRTASEGIAQDKLAQEMGFLKNLWSTTQKKYLHAPTPNLLHQELNVSLRAVRDLLIHEAEKLVIDSENGYQAILNFLDTFMSSLKDSVELYKGSEPIFDQFNLEGDISRALKRKVWLKSGGYIVIEHTEALTAIDVNTGRFVGKHNLEETIVKTNLEAVKEIAYQIRLRDIGGIIIIDFIDMERKSNQEKIFNALSEAFRKDRSKTHILPMSEMGLIQMTRKRTRKALTRLLCEPCFYCDGEGYLLSKQSICYNIYREIMATASDIVGHRLTLRVNPDIAELLHGEERRIIANLEQHIGIQIVIYPNIKYHLEEYDIIEVTKR